MGPEIAIGLGVVAVIVGIFIKPEDEDIGWGWFWGLAENSTLIGKCVFMAGVFATVFGVRGWMGV